MTDLDLQGVGTRVRHLRTLNGMTQQQLAARTNFSTSLVKKVEQGSVPASAAFVAASARALGVRLPYLYGIDDSELLDETSGIDSELVTALRSALDAYDDPQPEAEPMDLAAISGRLEVAGRDLDGQQYETAARELPELLQQLYVLAEDSGHRGEQARAALHDAYRIAASVAGRFRVPDLAAVASERHVQLAPSTGDQLRIVVSAYHRAAHLISQGDYNRAHRVLDRARQHLDHSPAGRALAIQLNLRSAVLCSRAADADRADEYIAEARAIAEQFSPPERPYFNIDASRLNIDVHWCAAPVENYDAAEAVRRGDQVVIADPARPERVGHHHIDQARAWMLQGDRGRSLAELNVAREASPRTTRHHPSVRETVLALAENDRRATDSLAGFARWARIEL